MSRKVAVRTDASEEIGIGHVMRCLALAGALRDSGFECHFLCRDHSGHLGAVIRDAGHGLTVLPAATQACAVRSSSEPAHSAWLGASWEEDAEQTVRELMGKGIDWLVVDHYSLDARWERAVRSVCHRVLVIDDLADREHACEVLLDQNLGRSAGDYAGLVPAGCEVVTGPSYALLRPGFGGLRKESLKRRHGGRFEHILVSMGGVDPRNATSEVLHALEDCDLPERCRVTVAMGPTAPWIASVASALENLGVPGELLVGVPNMAELMAGCDLAIGAGGGTSWERCALGLPAILFALADNQIASAEALNECGAALYAGGIEKIGEELPRAIATFRSSGVMQRASANAAAVTDGRGCTRVANLIAAYGRQSSNIVVREMSESDLDNVRAWRNAPEIRSSMYSQHAIDEQEHKQWFVRCTADHDRRLLIVERADCPLGFVQFHETSFAIADWGFYAAPSAPKGSGYALCSAALAHAFRELGLVKVSGQVIATNERSVVLHRRLGFTQEGILRKHYFNGQSFVDVICFGLLSGEFVEAN